MKYTGHLIENLAKMHQYFVNELGFECIDGDNFYEDKTIESELYLIQRELNLKIFIVKHFDDDEIDVTISGRPNNAEKYYDYVNYFLNPENVNSCCRKSVIDELNDYFKEYKNE